MITYYLIYNMKKMMNKILVQVPVSQIRSCNGHVTLIAHSTRDKMSTIMLQIVAVKREFEAKLRHAAIGKLFLSTQQLWVPFSNKGRIRQ